MASQQRVHCLPRAVDARENPAWTVTQSSALNSNSGPFDTDTNHSSCISPAAAGRRLSFRTYSNSERWTSSVELACDVNMRVSAAATSARLSALSLSPPEKPNNDGAVMGISLTSSAPAESQTEAQIHKDSPAQLCWTEGTEGKPSCPVQTVEPCAGSSVVPVANPNGASSVTHGDAAPGATQDANMIQVPPRTANISFRRMHHAPGAEATTASGSPDAGTPSSSTASTSPSRKPCNSVGVVGVAEADALRAKVRTTLPHCICAVVDMSGVKTAETTSNGEALALPIGPTTAEDICTMKHTFEAPCASEKGGCGESAQHCDKQQKSDVASSCAWSEEPYLAAASPDAGRGHLYDTSVTKHTATKSLCLSRETVETAASATEAEDAPVARRVSSAAASPAAAAAVHPAAPSVVDTEIENDDREGRTQQRSAQPHDQLNGTASDSDCGNRRDRSDEDVASADGPVPPPHEDVTSTTSQQAQAETGSDSVQLNEDEAGSTAHSFVQQSTGEATGSKQSNDTGADLATRANTKKNETSPVEERAGRLSDKLRAKFKREFNRSWVDINSAPSWPPIKKTKYLSSDWKIVDLRVGVPQRQEKKKNRLFLNSLCYLFDGVYTQKSTLGRKAGMGLFCERPEGFRKGQIITEFVGWLVDREQAESYRKQRAASHIVAVQKGFLYIDGAKEPAYGMGGGSFANDGSEFLGGPGNNAHFYHWFDDELGRTRVFIRATADIRSGQEIFVPYERTYWVDNFEEQAENCPEAFRKKKLEQLRRKIRHVEELNRNRLAANREKAAASGRATGVSQAARTLAKQKVAAQQPERRQLQEKNNSKLSRENLKRPLSGYMLFSRERWRELLLERQQATAQEQQLQVSSAEVHVRAPEKEAATPPLQTMKTQRCGKRRIKEEETTPDSNVEVEQHELCAAVENFSRNSELQQEGKKRLRSRKSVDISVTASVGHGVETHGPQDAAATGGQLPERARHREEDDMTSTRERVDGCFATGTTAADAAGPANLLRAEHEEAGVQTRRRSCWHSQGAAPQSSCAPGGAAADETLSADAEAERGEVAAAVGATRRSRAELANGKAAAHRLTDDLMMEKARLDVRGTCETGEGRRRSPRWLQASNQAPHLHASTARVLDETGGSGRSHVQKRSETEEEESVGRRRAIRTRASGGREADGDGQHCNRNMRSVGAARSDYATYNRKATPADSRGEGVSGACFVSTLASCWQKRKGSTAEREEANRDAGVVPEERDKVGCADGCSVACQPPATLSAPARLKADDACLQQKTRSHKEREGMADEHGAAKPVGGVGEAADACAAAGNRRSAVLQHFACMIRRVAGEWNAMSAHERRRWERLATKQRERYNVLRQKYNQKTPRRNAKQCSRCTVKKSLPFKRSKKVFHPQKKRGAKPAGTAEAPRAAAKATQRRMARRKTLTANSLAAAAATPTLGTSVAPEGAAAAVPKKVERRSTRSSAPYKSAVSKRMEQLTSEVSSHPVDGKEDNAAQKEVRNEAEVRAMGGKRCATRAAGYAAGAATEGTACAASLKDTLRKEQAQAEQVQVEHCVQPQQQPRVIQNTGEEEEEQQCYSHGMQTQQSKRSRRHFDTAESLTTSKKAVPDSVVEQKQQLSVSSWCSTSCVSSCSTTRSSSSSRNSSRGSCNHANSDASGNWQAPVERQNLSLYERADASVQISDVCGVPEGQEYAVDAERRGSLHSPQHQRDQRTSQQDGKLQCCPPATRQPHQQGGRCRQRKVGERRQSAPREECVPFSLREQRARGKRRRSWSPSCAARADRDFPAAS